VSKLTELLVLLLARMAYKVKANTIIKVTWTNGIWQFQILFNRSLFGLCKSCKIYRIVFNSTCADFHVLPFQCLFKELRCCSSCLRCSVYHLNLRITKIRSIFKRTTYFIIRTIWRFSPSHLTSCYGTNALIL